MFAGLNGYRTFAFLAVFFAHLNLFHAGYLGVQAFFVLSGFLITPILIETKYSTENIGSYLKNFLIRRTLRIFPLTYFYLTVILLVILLFGLQKIEYFKELKSQLIYGYTYTYNIFHVTKFFKINFFISHFWSLAVEEQFYLIWPFIIYFFTEKRIKFMLILLVLLGPIIRFFTSVFIEHHYLGLLTNNHHIAVFVSTFSHLDAFAIGGFFSVVMKRVISNAEFFLTGFVVLFLGIGTEFLSTSKIDVTSIGFAPFMNDSYKEIWGYSLVNYFFAILIYKIKTENFLSLIFENKFIVSLGIISYGLYVYHFGAIYLTQMFLEKYTSNYIVVDSFWFVLLKMIISFAITASVSYVSFHYFEKRFVKLKDIFAPKGK